MEVRDCVAEIRASSTEIHAARTDVRAIAMDIREAATEVRRTFTEIRETAMDSLLSTRPIQLSINQNQHPDRDTLTIETSDMHLLRIVPAYFANKLNR